MRGVASTPMRQESMGKLLSSQARIQELENQQLLILLREARKFTSPVGVKKRDWQH